MSFRWPTSHIGMMHPWSPKMEARERASSFVTLAKSALSGETYEKAKTKFPGRQAAETTKSFFEELGLLYVPYRSNVIKITPIGEQIYELIEGSDPDSPSPDLLERCNNLLLWTMSRCQINRPQSRGVPTLAKEEWTTCTIRPYAAFWAALLELDGNLAFHEFFGCLALAKHYEEIPEKIEEIRESRSRGSEFIQRSEYTKRGRLDNARIYWASHLSLAEVLLDNDGNSLTLRSEYRETLESVLSTLTACTEQDYIASARSTVYTDTDEYFFRVGGKPCPEFLSRGQNTLKDILTTEITTVSTISELQNGSFKLEGGVELCSLPLLSPIFCPEFPTRILRLDHKEVTETGQIIVTLGSGRPTLTQATGLALCQGDELMKKSGSTLSEIAGGGIVPPRSFQEEPTRVAEVAEIALEYPGDFDNAVLMARDGGFYTDEALESAIIDLATGHLIIAGPPGTGKTRLAHSLAKTFGAELIVSTANPEWSVYDIIGSLSLNASGGAIPKHGIVTNAILECASTIVRHLDTGEGPSAKWLLIDEINRAEIDRAFGPLFTALADKSCGEYSLDYISESPKITIPQRFRIIATMNDYDTKFVNGMSAALKRRFSRVRINSPVNVEGGLIPAAELEVAINAAKGAVTSRLGPRMVTDLSIITDNFEILRLVFGGVRSLDGIDGLPLSTALMIDCCVSILVMNSSRPNSFIELLDRAIESVLLHSLEGELLRHLLAQDYATAFASSFPNLKRANLRIMEILDHAA